MNYITEQLQSFLKDSLHPKRFIVRKLTNTEFDNWKNIIDQEANAIYLYAKEVHFRPKGAASQMDRLIANIVWCSNTVYKYMVKNRSAWHDHEQATLIGQHYSFTCERLETLINEIRELPKLTDKALITDYSLTGTKLELKKRLKHLELWFKDKTIEVELQQLIYVGLFQSIIKPNLTTSDKNFVIHILSVILKSKAATDSDLIDLLIIHDFDIPEFFLFCVNRWENTILVIDDLHQQREALLSERERFNLLRFHTRHKTKGSVVLQDLKSFLEEKYSYVELLLKIRRQALRDIEKAKLGIRFKINLPVPQFAIFIRLQLEKGIIPKEQVGELFSFFATHFYTANTNFISAESLQKKSTDIEFSNAQKMKSHLIGMLNWLNANFNLSNFN